MSLLLGNRVRLLFLLVCYGSLFPELRDLTSALTCAAVECKRGSHSWAAWTASVVESAVGQSPADLVHRQTGFKTAPDLASSNACHGRRSVG